MLNRLLYGRDPEENIVGVSRFGDNQVTVYTREDQRTVTSRREAIKPYAYFTAKGMELLDKQGFAGFDRYDLKGAGAYNTMLVFSNWRTHWDVVNGVRKYEHNGETAFKDEVYYHYSTPQQYLTQTGKTLYKGMTQATVKRMQFDIEVYSSTGAFPLAENPGDEIIMVQMSDNFGWEKVLVLDHPKITEREIRDIGFAATVHPDEADLLRAVVREISRHDPDVIEVHNGLAFDFPYVMERCRYNGVSFSIGRDRSEATVWTNKDGTPRTSQKKLAERDLEYHNIEIAGRAVIDTMFLTGAYDVFTRALDGWGLKPTAQHFRDKDGITYEEQHGHEREYIDGDQITQVWNDDPMRLITYAMDDVRETRYLSDKLAGATFYLSQMVPLSYQETHLAGTGRQIESIMVREYLTRMTALPEPQIGQQRFGGYTDIFLTGRFRNIVYVDVASLYPSIMLEYLCHPRSDELDVHRGMLKQLTALRLGVKAEAKQAKAEGRMADAAELSAREQSFKVVINSAYGVMGDSYSLFNDFDEADRVATTGQALLKRMIRLLELRGATIIECDTDGVLCYVPDDWTVDQKNQLVVDVSAAMPEGINVDNDGLYDVMISVAKKNYALRDYDGKVKTKGGAFKSRGLELFGREYLQRQLAHLMDGEVALLHAEHESIKARIVNRGLSIADFEKRANLKDSIATYRRKVASGSNRQAQYELAMVAGERDGRPPLKGDTIRYYISGSKKAYKVTGFVDGRLSEEWTPGDENVYYYLKRLQSFTQRFSTFFSKDDFKRVFSRAERDPNQIGLFGGHTYDLDGIEIATRRVKPTPSLLS